MITIIIIIINLLTVSEYLKCDFVVEYIVIVLYSI